MASVRPAQFQARQPIPVASPSAKAQATPAIPLAMPVGPAIQPAAVAAQQPIPDAFANLDGDGDGPAHHRRRYRRGGPKRWIFWGVFIVAAVLLGVVFWPLVQDGIRKAKSELASTDSPGEAPQEQPPGENPPRKSPTSTEPKEPAKNDSPKKDTPKKEVPKKDGPPKDNPRTDPPKKTPSKKDPPKKEKPTDPPVVSTGMFPRRVLAISINNYLYLNPINYGSSDRKAKSVRTLLERFTTGLKAPMEQVFELSDAAAMGRARPPVKRAVEKVVTDFLGTSRPQDRIILLLVAHTAEIGGEPYLIPLEGDQESKDQLIPLSWLYEKLAAAPARQKILILDTCRFNPTRGQERPGGDPMGEKLDARLKEPPPGVQVWTACVAGQRSHEFDSHASENNLDNGLFLDSLQRALLRGIEGTIQRPDEPIHVELLVDKVNALMKADLGPLKLVQTSRLSGKEAEGGAGYDPSQPPAAKFAVEVPRMDGDDMASLEEVRSILKEIDVPPLKLTREDMLVRAESMPPFSAKLLAQYKEDAVKSPFRDAVEKARRTLHEQLKGKRLQEAWPVVDNENILKAQVKDYQEKEVARTMRELEEALDDLRAAGKEGRKAEKSKRWLANYDYIFARLEAQLAYLYEYDSALGDMRKELPPKGPIGWRLASQKKLSGDSQGRKYMSDSGKLLDKLTKDHAGTPWEVLAKRDRLSNLGLVWQPNK
jgi:hypothetical protein